MFRRKKKWSKHPGCFERHLQRRHENVLFPLQRRNVSDEELEEARCRDKADQHNFNNKLSAFSERSQSLGIAKIEIASGLLQELQALIEEAASIGGEVSGKIAALESVERKLIFQLNEANPEGKDFLEQAQALSSVARLPFMAQTKRPDSPILEEEEVASLLSEDWATVAMIGHMSRRFPNFKPSIADIENHLDRAVKQGFNKKTAQEIIQAWNSG